MLGCGLRYLSLVFPSLSLSLSLSLSCPSYRFVLIDCDHRSAVASKTDPNRIKTAQNGIKRREPKAEKERERENERKKYEYI